MPLIRVELFDYRMSDETSAALIEKLTDALGEATHPGLKEHTWVIVEGHNPKNWGLAGKPWPVDRDATGSIALESRLTRAIPSSGGRASRMVSSRHRASSAGTRRARRRGRRARRGRPRPGSAPPE